MTYPTRFKFENNKLQIIEEGCVVTFPDNPNIYGLVLPYSPEHCMVQIRLETGSVCKVHVDKINKETRIKAHCHGCDRYTKQEIYPLSPQHATGRTFGWECSHCRFINQNAHLCIEVGDALKCVDCQHFAKLSLKQK